MNTLIEMALLPRLTQAIAPKVTNSGDKPFYADEYSQGSICKHVLEAVPRVRCDCLLD